MRRPQSRSYHVGYERSLRPCLAPPSAPRRRVLTTGWVLSIHPGARAFALTAEAYERARPTYPAEAIDWAIANAALEPGAFVIDLAAGTGKLTRLLVGRGFRVLAVEPVDEMRQLLTSVVPEAAARAGTADAIPAPDRSAAAVTVAQAFHWFDPATAIPEIARVVRSGGALVIVANVRDLDDLLQAELTELMAPHRAAYPSPHWDNTLGANEHFEAPLARTFPNVQLLDRATVVERVASVSWIGALPDDERARVLNEARSLVADRAEPIEVPYVTQVFVCRRR